MKILKTNVYVGPNLYAHFPVIRYILDLGELEHWPSGRLGEAFIGRLLELLPGLDEHGCSYREPGGFVRRLREDGGTWLGHVMEHVVLELQNIAGSDVSFAQAWLRGRWHAIFGEAMCNLLSSRCMLVLEWASGPQPSVECRHMAVSSPG